MVAEGFEVAVVAGPVGVSPSGFDGGFEHIEGFVGEAGEGEVAGAVVGSAGVACGGEEDEGGVGAALPGVTSGVLVSEASIRPAEVVEGVGVGFAGGGEGAFEGASLFEGDTPGVVGAT